MLNGKIVTKHTSSSSLLTRLDESATTTVDEWTTTNVTLGDALDILDDAPMWKVYEGYHGNQADHSRKYILGYI